MRCPECVKECKAEGGICEGGGVFVCPCGNCGCGYKAAEDCHCDEPCWINPDIEQHVAAKHTMALVGGHYRCDKGHDPIEANPVDAMRAAGLEPML